METLKNLPLADVDGELAISRRVLERLPEDRLAWKPHARSKSIGELGAHIAEVVGYQTFVLRQDELDFAASPPPVVTPDSKIGILEAFDSNVADLREAIENIDESTLTRDWTLRIGEHVIFTSPKIVTLRSFGISHIAHHRGQLSVYLRLLDLPVPPVYGPTADEG